MEKVKKLRAEKALIEQKPKAESKYFTEPLVDPVEDEDKRNFSKFPVKKAVPDENDDETPVKVKRTGGLVPKSKQSEDLADDQITSPFGDYR